MKPPSPPRTSVRQLLSDGKEYTMEEIISHLNRRRRECGLRQRDSDKLKEIVASMLHKMETRGSIRSTIEGRYQLVLPPPSAIDDSVIFDALSHKVIADLAETSLLGLLNSRLVAKGSRSVSCTELKALNAKEGRQLSSFQRQYAAPIKGITAVRDEMGLSLADLKTVTSIDQSMLQIKLDQMIREGTIQKTQLDRYKRRI